MDRRSVKEERLLTESWTEIIQLAIQILRMMNQLVRLVSKDRMQNDKKFRKVTSLIDGFGRAIYGFIGAYADMSQHSKDLVLLQRAMSENSSSHLPKIAERLEGEVHYSGEISMVTKDNEIIVTKSREGVLFYRDEDYNKCWALLEYHRTKRRERGGIEVRFAS